MKQEIKRVSDLLGTGKENAVLMKDLQKMAGYSSIRGLREAIDRERREGILICSGNAGFYKPANREELEEFVARMHSTAMKILLDAAPASRELKKMDGQMNLTDLFGYLEEMEGGEAEN